METLPFSQSCENNKPFILEVLKQVFTDSTEVLEIASGTGQHACYFASQMPWLQWQPTELKDNLPLLRPRCGGYEGDNLQPPLVLDVTDTRWPVPVPTAVFSANSLHIMSYSAVQALFTTLSLEAPEQAVLAVYGPFNYNGRYTSDSNARFDQWLVQRDSDSGIRDFESVNDLANAAAFTLLSDNDMPANNRLLVWQKSG